MPSVCLLTLGLDGTRTRMLQSAISLDPTPLMLQSAICLRIFPFHMQALFSCASVLTSRRACCSLSALSKRDRPLRSVYCGPRSATDNQEENQKEVRSSLPLEDI